MSDADRRGGEPLVLLVPGLGLDDRAWRRVQPLLACESEVVPLPVMGRRPGRGEDLDVRSQAARLVERLPARDGLVLVGHSASCQVVTEAARAHPGVRALVLVGPTTDPDAATWPRLVARWLRTARHEHLWELRAVTPQYRRNGLTHMTRAMDRMRHHRTDLALAAAPGTVLVVVRGEHDRIASARWCAELSAGADGTLTTVGGAAHMVPLTHPRAVAEAVEGACRAVSRG